jgi:hypothetical protein
MPVRSVSFDDDSDEELCVFSGGDLLLAHYDVVDLDWGEVADRSLIDERRGLAITQVVAIEDLIDEFILYLADPPDPARFRDEKLNGVTIGPRLGMLEMALRSAGLLDGEAADCLSAARAMVSRRNQLAHGTIHCRPTRVVPIADLAHVDLDIEWVLVDRRSGEADRISMAGLRHDVYDAIGVFTSLLAYAERFVERAPAPEHFAGGQYLGTPTP